MNRKSYIIIIIIQLNMKKFNEIKKNIYNKK